MSVRDIKFGEAFYDALASILLEVIDNGKPEEAASNPDNDQEAA